MSLAAPSFSRGAKRVHAAYPLLLCVVFGGCSDAGSLENVRFEVEAVTWSARSAATLTEQTQCEPPTRFAPLARVTPAAAWSFPDGRRVTVANAIAWRWDIDYDRLLTLEDILFDGPTQIRLATSCQTDLHTVWVRPFGQGWLLSRRSSMTQRVFLRRVVANGDTQPAEFTLPTDAHLWVHGDTTSFSVVSGYRVNKIGDPDAGPWLAARLHRIDTTGATLHDTPITATPSQHLHAIRARQHALDALVSAPLDGNGATLHVRTVDSTGKLTTDHPVALGDVTAISGATPVRSREVGGFVALVRPATAPPEAKTWTLTWFDTAGNVRATRALLGKNTALFDAHGVAGGGIRIIGSSLAFGADPGDLQATHFGPQGQASPIVTFERPSLDLRVDRASAAVATEHGLVTVGRGRPIVPPSRGPKPKLFLYVALHSYAGKRRAFAQLGAPNDDARVAFVSYSGAAIHVVRRTKWCPDSVKVVVPEDDCPIRFDINVVSDR